MMIFGRGGGISNVLIIPKWRECQAPCRGGHFHSFDALSAPALRWNPGENRLAGELNGTERPTSRRLSPRQCLCLAATNGESGEVGVGERGG